MSGRPCSAETAEIERARRSLLASWLGRAFAREPDRTALAAVPAAARLLLAPGEARDRLVAAAEAGDLDAIAAEQARLFYSAGPKPVHPVESAWGPGDGILDEAARAEMAETLDRLGLQTDPEFFREPEDHISVELEALATAWERGEDEQAEALLARLRRWVPGFAARLRRVARGPWHRGLAAALEELIS